MSAVQISSDEARARMHPADVIAFGGKGPFFAEIIKFANFSTVSHIGVILQNRTADDDTGRF